MSRLCEEIDERVKAFLERPIEGGAAQGSGDAKHRWNGCGGDWPYIWIDATYLKVRQAGRIVSVAVTIAVGVNGDGRREVLGMPVLSLSKGRSAHRRQRPSGPTSCAASRGAASRGVKALLSEVEGLVVSDAHEGIKASVARVFSAGWQRCRVHFARNALAHAGRSGRRVVSAFIATAFAQETADAAKVQWRKVADQLRPTVPKALLSLSKGLLPSWTPPKRTCSAT